MPQTPKQYEDVGWDEPGQSSATDSAYEDVGWDDVSPKHKPKRQPKIDDQALRLKSEFEDAKAQGDFTTVEDRARRLRKKGWEAPEGQGYAKPPAGADPALAYHGLVRLDRSTSGRQRVGLNATGKMLARQSQPVQTPEGRSIGPIQGPVMETAADVASGTTELVGSTISGLERLPNPRVDIGGFPQAPKVQPPAPVQQIINGDPNSSSYVSPPIGGIGGALHDTAGELSQYGAPEGSFRKALGLGVGQALPMLIPGMGPLEIGAVSGLSRYGAGASAPRALLGGATSALGVKLMGNAAGALDRTVPSAVGRFAGRTLANVAIPEALGGATGEGLDLRPQSLAQKLAFGAGFAAMHGGQGVPESSSRPEQRLLPAAGETSPSREYGQETTFLQGPGGVASTQPFRAPVPTSGGRVMTPEQAASQAPGSFTVDNPENPTFVEARHRTPLQLGPGEPEGGVNILGRSGQVFRANEGARPTITGRDAPPLGPEQRYSPQGPEANQPFSQHAYEVESRASQAGTPASASDNLPNLPPEVEPPGAQSLVRGEPGYVDYAHNERWQQVANKTGIPYNDIADAIYMAHPDRGPRRDLRPLAKIWQQAKAEGANPPEGPWSYDYTGPQQLSLGQRLLMPAKGEAKTPDQPTPNSPEAQTVEHNNQEDFVARDSKGNELWRGPAMDAMDALTQAGKGAVNAKATRLEVEAERDRGTVAEYEQTTDERNRQNPPPDLATRLNQLKEITQKGETKAPEGIKPPDASPEYNTILKNAGREIETPKVDTITGAESPAAVDLESLSLPELERLWKDPKVARTERGQDAYTEWKYRKFKNQAGFVLVNPEDLKVLARPFTSFWDAFRKLAAPVGRSEESRTMAGIIRERGSEKEVDILRAEQDLKAASKAIPQLHRLDVINSIESPKSPKAQQFIQQNPHYANFITAVRKVLDSRRTAVQNLGTGQLQQFNENYFPHLWKDPDHATSFLQEFMAKRPFEGNKSWTKKRTIPTVEEGISKGLKLITDDPVELTLIQARRMDHYIMAHKVIQEAETKGLVKKVAARYHLQPGESEIDDPMMKVYAPPNRRGGLSIQYRYVAPEPTARIINNHLSPGLRNQAWFRSANGMGNLLNMAQLGLSFRHAFFVATDAMMSQTALAVMEGSRANVMGVAKNLAKTPGAWASSFNTGTKLMRELATPGSQGTEIAQIFDALTAGGARFKQDQVYATHLTDSMMKAFREDSVLGKLKGTTLAPFAAVEQFARPIMEVVVPRMKLGVAAEMARFELERLGPNATREQLRQAMATAWDSVDNRMGQLVYDNLFMNKVGKDIAMASTRSVGWNLGTMREIGGGMYDTLANLGRLGTMGATKATGGQYQGKPIEFTHRMSYVAALPAIAGTMGALTQALLTWHTTGKAKWPGELLDYFMPQTGNIDEHGRPERVSLPSYMKDVFEYMDDPVKTVRSKVHPMINTLAEMWQNKDFYNVQIRNPDSPALLQLLEVANYARQSFNPISQRGLQREKELAGKKESFPLSMVPTSTMETLPWIGVNRAPLSISQTPAQKLLAQYTGENQSVGARTREEADRAIFKTKVVRDIKMGRGGEDYGEILKWYQSGKLSEDDMDDVMDRLEKGYLTYGVNKLQFDQALEIYRRGDQQEKLELKELVIDKAVNEAERFANPEKGKEIMLKLKKAGILPSGGK